MVRKYVVVRGDLEPRITTLRGALLSCVHALEKPAGVDAFSFDTLEEAQLALRARAEEWANDPESRYGNDGGTFQLLAIDIPTPAIDHLEIVTARARVELEPIEGNRKLDIK